MLGVGLLNAVNHVSTQAEENFTTIATFHYIGIHYPEEMGRDQEFYRDTSTLGWSIIKEHPDVISWQPSSNVQAITPGFVRRQFDAPFAGYGIYVVEGFLPGGAQGMALVHVREQIFAYANREGRYIAASFPEGWQETGEGWEFVPPFEQEGLYIVKGRYLPVLGRFARTFTVLTFPPLVYELVGISEEDIPHSLLSITEGVSPEALDIYHRMARFFYEENRVINTRFSDNIESLYEFAQGQAWLLEGRLFEEEEYIQANQVVVITSYIANIGEFAVGDSIPLTFIERFNMLGGEVLEEPRGIECEGIPFTVIGIVETLEEHRTNIYLSNADKPMYLETNGISSYYLGQARLYNGRTRDFLETMEELLPSRVVIRVYDQGYESVMRSANAVQQSAGILLLICVLVGMAVLSLFALIFIQRQGETVNTMLLLGTSTGKVRLYLLCGCGSLAIIAAYVGAFIGASLSGMVSSMAFDQGGESTVESVTTIDFSDRAMGFVLEMDYVFPPIPLGVVLLTGTGLIVATFLFLLAFARKTINHRAVEMNKRVSRKPRTTNISIGPKKPRRASLIPGTVLKYALLSIARGGRRTFAIPVFCFIMTLFFLGMWGLQHHYESEIHKSYDSAIIQGHFTNVSGRSIDRLLLDSDKINRARDSGFFAEFDTSVANNYIFLGVSRTKEGEFQHPEFVFPVCVFGADVMIGHMSEQPAIYYTTRLEQSPEFYAIADEEIEIDFWDDDSPLLKELKENGLLTDTSVFHQGGQSFLLYGNSVVSEDDIIGRYSEIAYPPQLSETAFPIYAVIFTDASNWFAVSLWNQHLQDPYSMQVVFTELQRTILVPNHDRPIMGFEEIQGVNLEQALVVTPIVISEQFAYNNQVRHGDVIRLMTRRSLRVNETARGETNTYGFQVWWWQDYIVIGSFNQHGNMQHLYVPYNPKIHAYPMFEESLRIHHQGPFTSFYVDADFHVTEGITYSAANFTLADARELEQVKAFFAEEGFSPVGRRDGTGLSMFVIIKDGAFSAFMEDIENYLFYISVLFPIMVVITLAISVFVSYLLLASRKNDFAIMKGLGTGGIRMFSSFFGEQVILAGGGSGVALIVFAGFFGFRIEMLLSVGIYGAIYLAGAICAIVVFNRMSTLRLFAEKE